MGYIEIILSLLLIVVNGRVLQLIITSRGNIENLYEKIFNSLFIADIINALFINTMLGNDKNFIDQGTNIIIFIIMFVITINIICKLFYKGYILLNRDVFKKYGEIPYPKVGTEIKFSILSFRMYMVIWFIEIALSGYVFSLG